MGKIFIIGYRFNALSVGAFALGLMLYFIQSYTFAAWNLGHSMQPDMLGMMYFLMTDAKHLIALFGSTVIALLPDFTYAVVQRTLFPTPLDRFMYRVRSGIANGKVHPASPPEELAGS